MHAGCPVEPEHSVAMSGIKPPAGALLTLAIENSSAGGTGESSKAVVTVRSTMPKPVGANTVVSVSSTATGVTLCQPNLRSTSVVNADPYTVTSVSGIRRFGYTPQVISGGRVREWVGRSALKLAR